MKEVSILHKLVHKGSVMCLYFMCVHLIDLDISNYDLTWFKYTTDNAGLLGLALSPLKYMNIQRDFRKWLILKTQSNLYLSIYLIYLSCAYVYKSRALCMLGKNISLSLLLSHLSPV